MDEEYWEHCPPGEYMAEACREYARNHGEMNPEIAWIVTPFDSVLPNPYYDGPPVPHPEEN